ncbi:MAG: hypothetical protein ACFFD2_18825, partial [Promethearchaeota archaeon]
YAQRINSTGQFPWGAPKAIATRSPYDELEPKICGDGNGSAIITWNLEVTSSNYGLFTQKINLTGQVQWDTDGKYITWSPKFMYQKICSDGYRGALVTWVDHSGGSDDIYVQRISPNGGSAWGSSGLAVCTDSNTQGWPDICYDGLGGAIVSWHDQRYGNWDIFAQKIASNGITQWTANGIPICVLGESQLYPQICGDGQGGGLITWEDYRVGSNSYDIYAQYINSNGTLEWESIGLLICNQINNQLMPEICTNGSENILIIWQDYRFGNNDIFAQSLKNIPQVVPGPRSSPEFPIIISTEGDISQLLLSPLGLGIIGGIAAYAIVATVLLARNLNKTNERLNLIDKKVTKGSTSKNMVKKPKDSQ